MIALSSQQLILGGNTLTTSGNNILVNGNNITGAVANTGQLTGQFYPLNINPLNYFINSGNSFVSYGFGQNVKTVTGNYNFTNLDFTVLFSGNGLTGTLPSAIINSGLIYDIVNIFGTVIITGSQNINTSNTYSDLSVNKGQQIQSNGVQWWIIRTTPTGGLTGQFYPLWSNPSGYVFSSQTGNFISNGQTGILTNQFVSQSQTGVFVVTGNTGIFVTIYQTGGFGTGGAGNINTGALTGIFTPLNKNYFISGNYNISLNSGLSPVYFVNALQLVSGNSGNAVPVNITFPNASGALGYEFTVKDWKGNSYNNNITLTGTGNQTFDGGLNLIMNTNYSSYTLISDGNNWTII